MLKADPDQLANQRHWGGHEIGSSLIDSLIWGGGGRIKGHVETFRLGVYGYFDQHGNKIEKPDLHTWFRN